MKRKNKKTKHENDEYSILKENVEDNSGCKWDTFNKTNAETVKSYNLNDIFNEHEPLKKDTKVNSIMTDRDNILKSGIQNHNISVKRYFESINNTEMGVDGSNAENISNKELFKELEQTIFSHKDLNNNTTLQNNENSLNKVQADVAMCRSLLNKREKQNLTGNDYKDNPPSINKGEISNLSKDIKTISYVNDSLEFIGKRKSIEEICVKKPKDSVEEGINDYQSTIIETKKRIDLAIEEVNTKNIMIKKNESTLVVRENTLVKNKNLENFKKKNNSLEKENRILNLKIEALQHKISYLTADNQPNTDNNLYEEGKKVIKNMRSQLNVVEQEYKTTIDKLNKNNKRFEQEIVGLKQIINKLVDKIKIGKSNK